MFRALAARSTNGKSARLPSETPAVLSANAAARCLRAGADFAFSHSGFCRGRWSCQNDSRSALECTRFHNASISMVGAIDCRNNLLLRFFGDGAGSDARRVASAVSLVSRSSRSRAMFFRTSAACLSTSANARAPSSAASLLRLRRAIPSGDGADFLALIFHPALPRPKPAQSGDRAGRAAVSVHP